MKKQNLPSFDPPPTFPAIEPIEKRWDRNSRIPTGSCTILCDQHFTNEDEEVESLSEINKKLDFHDKLIKDMRKEFQEELEKAREEERKATRLLEKRIKNGLKNQQEQINYINLKSKFNKLSHCIRGLNSPYFDYRGGGGWYNQQQRNNGCVLPPIRSILNIPHYAPTFIGRNRPFPTKFQFQTNSKKRIVNKQTKCCIIDCSNEVVNSEYRLDLNDNYFVKSGFLAFGWTKVCQTHYNSQWNI